MDVKDFILKEFSVQKKEGYQGKIVISNGHHGDPYIEKDGLREPDDIIIEIKVSPKSNIATQEHFDYIYKVLNDSFNIVQ